MNPQDLVTQTFRNRFGHEPDFLAIAPGRVNILGEHVDYNDGMVLPAAIDRFTFLAFAPASEKTNQSTLVAADFSEEVAFTLEGISFKKDADGISLTDWALYPAGVAWAMVKAGLTVKNLEGVFASDIPIGAGLSSSASVEMAFAVAWQELGGREISPLKLALLGQEAENHYVGVNCGIMDQFASACGIANRLLLLDCRSLEWRPIPLPENISIIIADTTVRRKLIQAGYNQRRQACEEAVRILSEYLPGIKALRDVRIDDFNRLRNLLPKQIEKRARHVIEEIERTRQAIPFLEKGKITEFGKIINACHFSLRGLYEVSIPELDTMVEIAQRLPGCYGARLTGAGFGGCTVNLVDQAVSRTFADELANQFQVKTGIKPEIYICRASNGAGVMEKG